MYGGSGRKRQKYGTELKYDGLHRGEKGEEEGFKARAFRSSRHNRFEFKKQDKKEFQDEEDLVNELGHLKLVSNYRDLTTALEIELNEFDKDTVQQQIPSGVSTKKSRKNKVKIKYHYEEDDDETPDLEIKLKTVDSKLKFQKNLPRAVTPTRQMTDVIYKRFTKKVQPSKPTSKYDIPEDYVSKYRLVHPSSAPLSRHAATSLLNSRFTSSDSPTQTATSQETSSSERHSRTVQKIEVSELLRKRLGI